MLEGRRGWIVLGAIAVAALVGAWWIRWGCDDAYISYVYARGFVYGDGLTWFGEHLEGYTNFLWVLWIAIGVAAGIDPLVWSWVGSLAAMGGVLVVVFRLGLVRTASPIAALCAVAMLATNYTFIAFGTSGLETMLQCLLLTSAWFVVERVRRGDGTVRRLAALSLLAALALMTRLDSTVYLLVIGVAALSHLVRTGAPRMFYVAAIAPALVLVGGWLAWKLAYYGDIVPNTFHAKVDVSAVTLKAAALFVWAFLKAYSVWPLLIGVVLLAVVQRRFAPRLPAVLVTTWLAYVIFVGGDFMEFRFFVPILPPLFVMIAEVIAVGADKPAWASPAVRSVVLVIALGVFSYRHATSFTGSDDGYFDSVTQLGTFYGKVQDNDWGRLGTHIGDVLVDSGATLASNGAGAIPYFADLPTVDQLGLNDRWVARHGAKGNWSRPGHQRFATHDYLAERKVTLVIGSPVLIQRGVLARFGLTRGVLYWAERLLGPTPIKGDSIVAVAAPVDENKALLMWYLTPSDEITRRMEAAGWEIRELFRR